MPVSPLAASVMVIIDSESRSLLHSNGPGCQWTRARAPLAVCSTRKRSFEFPRRARATGTGKLASARLLKFKLKLWLRSQQPQSLSLGFSSDRRASSCHGPDMFLSANMFLSARAWRMVAVRRRYPGYRDCRVAAVPLAVWHASCRAAPGFKFRGGIDPL